MSVVVQHALNPSFSFLLSPCERKCCDSPIFLLCPRPQIVAPPHTKNPLFFRGKTPNFYSCPCRGYVEDGGGPEKKNLGVWKESGSVAVRDVFERDVIHPPPTTL